MHRRGVMVFETIGGSVNDSVQILRRQLEDPVARENLSESIAITSLLAGCVIGKQYRVPDAMTTPIALSELGREVFDGVLASNKRVKPNELKLGIFFHIGCPEGLLIEANTDIPALRHAISAEMRSSKILFPYIYGRDLHDKAATTFPEKTYLNNTQSIALLKQLPQGVFQEGRTVVGPLGAIQSDTRRTMMSRLAVPGYLCSDETCSAVHSIELTTSDSSISRTQEIVSSFVSKHHGGTDDDHARVIQESTALDYSPVSHRPSEGMFDVLADAFTEEELRSVTEAVLRSAFKEDGGRAKVSKRLGEIINSPAEYVASLARSSLLQVLLTFDDDAVILATDSTIGSGGVRLAEYEIRVSRLNRNVRSDWQAEIGPLGVRSTAPQAVAERLYSLLRRLYYEAGILEGADLAYGLARTGAPASSDLLGQAVRQLSPRELLEELVLVNRQAAAEATNFLGVTVQDDATRPDLLESMLWKLGAPSEVLFTELSRMATYESDLAAANTSSAAQEVIRGHISNLFTATEDALQRALTYSTWALTEDHFLTQVGFEYDPLPNVAHLEYLEEVAPTEVEALRLKHDGKNTLAPLAAGFGRLAKGLKASRSSPSRRPKEQLPLACSIESRPFAFPYASPYLNLEEESQVDLLTQLQEIASLFSNATVAKVRNATMHGNNEFPSGSEIGLALEKVGKGRDILSATGLFPQVYSLASDLIDSFGRRELRYVRGERLLPLYAPVWPVVMDMPFKQSRLIIMEGATLSAAGPMRFRIKPRPGTDEFWDGWPKRWRVERAYTSSDQAKSSDQGTAGVMPADVG